MTDQKVDATIKALSLEFKMPISAVMRSFNVSVKLVEDKAITVDQISVAVGLYCAAFNDGRDYHRKMTQND